MYSLRVKMTIVCNLLQGCYVDVNNIEVFGDLLRFSSLKGEKENKSRKNDKI
jgi:hypothetical protein